MTAPDMRGRLKAIRARGGRVIVVDPRSTGTTKLADEHLPIRPGTDALLLFALVQVLVAEDLVDSEPASLSRADEAAADAGAGARGGSEPAARARAPSRSPSAAAGAAPEAEAPADDAGHRQRQRGPQMDRPGRSSRASDSTVVHARPGQGRARRTDRVPHAARRRGRDRSGHVDDRAAGLIAR